MTILSKNIRRAIVPGSPGSPGLPGQAYLPARSAYELETVCSWVSPSESDIAAAYAAAGVSRVYGIVRYDADGTPIYGWITPTGVSVRVPFYTYVCEPTMVRHDYPAVPYVPPTPPVPATPAQFVADFSLGWNGRAASNARFVGNGAFEFRTQASNVGAVVGLSAAPQTSGYADILHGFYLAGGIARVYEAGEEALYIGVFSSADVFKVQRAGDTVYYFIDDVEVHDSPAAEGVMHLAAALYAGGDTVIGAEFVAGGSAAGSLLALQAISGEAGYTGAISSGSFLPLTGSASVGAQAGGSLSALAGLAGKAYSLADGELMAITGAAEGYIDAPPYALASGYFELMSGAASMLTGSVGGGATAIQAMGSLSYDRDFGDARGTMPAVSGSAFSYEAPTEATVFSGAFAGFDAVGFAELGVVMTSSAQVAVVFTLQSVQDAAVESAATASSTLLTQQTIEALLMALAQSSSLQFDDAADLTIWTVNTENAGTTRYDNYGFNSFAKIGAKYFGAKADGVFELAGATDAGDEIPALVNLGKSDWGSSLKKNIDYCYLGVASDGKMVLKVIADGQTYLYTARNSSDGMSTQRVSLGRGLRANFYEFELQNAAGGAFELSRVEFTPIPLSRRI